MKVLISPLYGLGDVIMTFPAIEILRKSKPDWRIDYFTFNPTIQKILNLNPNIDNVIYEPILNYSKLEVVFFLLKRFFRRYDITINFYPSNRLDYNIFSFLTLSKLRIGHSYLNQNTLQFNFLKNKTIKEDPILHCVEENVKLLELFGIDTKDVPIPKLSIYIDEKMKLEGEEYIKDKNRVKVGLHPGSSRFKNHKYRRWKKENFVKLIRHFKDFDFYVFGSKEEEDEVYYITSNTTNSVPIVDIDILNVIKIVSNMDLFVSNDSGLMHLANALNVPTIGIFGPTNPVWVRPWNEPYKVVRLNLDCSPCFVYSPKPLECKIKDKYKCLNELDESLVIDAVKELLQDVS